MTAPKRILGRAFLQALADAGIIRIGERNDSGVIVGDSDFVRRVVIDASVDGAVVLYVERYGDERLLSVASTLEGVKIREIGRPEGGGR